jgi:hypothetical protein
LKNEMKNGLRNERQTLPWITLLIIHSTSP